MKFETKVIHAGQAPDPRTGAVMTPIYATSTYAQSSPGEHKGYDYARTRNPTRDALEACVAELEGGKHGFAFASGMAAIGTVLELLDSGSHVVAMDDLYGGSYRILERVRKRSAALQPSFVDLSKTENLEAAIRPNTKSPAQETVLRPMTVPPDMASGGRCRTPHLGITEAAAEATRVALTGPRPTDDFLSTRRRDLRLRRAG